MNATAPANETKPANPPPREIIRVEDGMQHLMDTGKFEQLQRLATMMAYSTLLPKHLRCEGKEYEEWTPADKLKGQTSNCFRVADQALRWGFDPFAVMDETYVVHGRLGYQGKLVAAVVNTRADMHQPLQYRYNNGKGDDLAIVCYASTMDIPAEAMPLIRSYAENEDRNALNDLADLGVLAVRVSVRQAKTDNDMWKKDPEQKLVYNGAIKWARRHRPEIVMGVLTDDDIDAIASQSAAPALREPARTREELTGRLETRIANGNGGAGNMAGFHNGSTVQIQEGAVVKFTDQTTDPPTVEAATTQTQTPPVNNDPQQGMVVTFDSSAIPAGLEAFAAACDKAIAEAEIDAAVTAHVRGQEQLGEAAVNWAAGLVDYTLNEIGKPLRPDAAAYLERIKKAGTPSGLQKLLADAEADAAQTGVWTPREVARFRAAAALKFPGKSSGSKLQGME